jgi:hypothetical protein
LFLSENNGKRIIIEKDYDVQAFNRDI